MIKVERTKKNISCENNKIHKLTKQKHNHTFVIFYIVHMLNKFLKNISEKKYSQILNISNL